MNTETLKRQIVERLRWLDLERVILFGSYAWEHPDKESDVDLYVVTKDDSIPRSWKERNALYLKVLQQLDDLDVPIDLVVHTRGMYRRISSRSSSFWKRVLQRGEVLL